MNLIATLRATRPSLSHAELLCVRSPSVRFEGFDELKDDVTGDARRFRVYTIDGHLYDKQPMLVPAVHSVTVADEFANQGLLSTLIAAKQHALGYESGLELDAVTPPTANGSDGLSAEQRALLDRILAKA